MATVKDVQTLSSAAKRGCPFHTQKVVMTQAKWWPNQLNLKPLKKEAPTNSLAGGFDYAKEFETLDLSQVRADLLALMTDSQDWWPADWGHYGPFFIRMAWHSAGTYRIFDGRGGAGGGNLRFAPLNSWPDNGNLDKAKRLLWPIKQKYGRKLSWADLMIFTGNCALESMGLKPFGFAGGREDLWEPEEDIYWGQETEWLQANRGGLGEALDKPLGAVQMGLIYVNPEGPGGNADALQSAQDIRATFRRMAMNDEETVALIAGGHTFGKGHGASDPANVGPEPEGASIQEQGFGWKNSFGTGKGKDTITSGLEGAWTANPIQWDNGYFDNLMGFEWEQAKSPAGATIWVPKEGAHQDMVPDAHVEGKKNAPVMFTSDLALKLDPEYNKISKRFHENPDQFADAFARAWYKLTHRDMGPIARCYGAEVPEAQIWQDPVPPKPEKLVTDADVATLKEKILTSGPSVGQLVHTAWASASTFRCTDKRGGANGARINLEPQKSWAANKGTAEVIAALDKIRKEFNEANAENGLSISLADTIVLGGVAAVEASAKAAGIDVTVPFSPGRTDATEAQTDAESFAVLEPIADGFRNHFAASEAVMSQAEAMLVDKAHMLTLSKAEMTVLVGGLRVLGANTDGSSLGVFTDSPGKLNNAFFVNLLDMGYVWSPVSAAEDTFEGKNRKTGEAKWRGTRVDLIFGSNSELRAISEYYACSDSNPVFVADFVAAFSKVMNLDRFDLKE